MKLLKFLVVAGLLLLSAVAYADVFQTYNIAWSGASFGNTAAANGQITLDLTTLPNPGPVIYDMIGDISSLSLTITGASIGNGTWTQSDLAPLSFLGTNTYWWTGGSALNLNQELVGQPTMGSAWGTADGSSGDFNFFFTNGGPQGSFYFTLTTAGGLGDAMALTSVAPAGSSVPEPGSMLLMGSGLAMLAGAIRRKFLQ